MIKRIHTAFIFIFLLTPFLGFSTHVVGGALTYVYNGGSNYTITLKLYRDCGVGTAAAPGNVLISVVDQFGNAFNPSKDITINLTSITQLNSTLDPCAVAPNPLPCVQEAIYTKTVNSLPAIVGGYHMYYTICCRNGSILNITNPGGTSETYYAHIPGIPITSIWNEDFTLANGTTVDNGTTSWSMVNGSTAPSSFGVNSNQFQVFGANNASNMWSSQVVSISSCTNVALSVNLSESGSLDPNDSIKVYYRINGGPLILFSTNGSIADDFTSAIASASNIAGSTIQIVIRTKFDGSSPNSEIYKFDNVIISCIGSSMLVNSNPVFNLFPPLFICVNQPFTFNHAATDADGDSLVYGLYTPYNSGPPTFSSNTATFTPVTYAGAYSYTGPLGGPFSINSSTGLLSGTPTTLGQFVVGVIVKEYRNGVYIGETLRDFQFNVLNCPQPPPTLAVANATINNGCNVKPIATGITSVSATWTSIFPGAQGAYNNYLGCTSGCLTNTINPVGVPPPYVDFKVCGSSISCAGNFICDTFRIYFNSALTVSIFPSNPTLCFGQTSTTISAVGVGGTPPYSYLWNNVNPSQTINVGIGTYNVQLTDGSGCPPVYQAVTVTAFTAAITANAGANQTKCKQNSIATLNGAITGASGGIWSGGSGTFLPNNTTLSNVTYSPSAAELLAGSVTLSLTSTGNGSCPLAVSTITLTYVNFTGALTSSVTNPSCFGSTNGTATVSIAGGFSPYTYNWTTSPTQTTSTVNNLPIGTYSVTILDAIGCSQKTVVTIVQPPVLAINSTFTNVSCAGGNNGAINTTAVGGTTPYTYSWVPSGQTTASLTNLIAGNYSLTVTDARGCAKTASFTVTQPATLTIAVTQTNVSCFNGNNGAVTVVTAGGTAPYSFSWLPNGATASSISGLTAGDYTLNVIDNKNCTITNTLSITQPTLLVAATTATNETCNYLNNGVASVTVIGGSAPYTYTWSYGGQTTSTISNLSSGNYNVTITDNKGCIATTNATINEPPVLTVGLTSQVNVSCFGGNNASVYASPNGGTASYSYSWSPSGQTTAQLTNASIGTYTIKVIDSQSCIATNIVTITQPTSITVTSTITNVSCNGGGNGSISLTTSGGATPYTYLWTVGGQTTDVITGLSMGNYPVTVTDANGCTKTLTLSVTQPSSMTVVATQTNVSCFGGNNAIATATATGGTPSYTYLWQPNGQTTSSITNLTSGTYTVIVKDNLNCSLAKTITITQPTQLFATTSTTNETCNYLNNGLANVLPSGGTAGYTYSWSPSSGITSTIAGLASGTYSVKITDANLCFITKTVVITEPAALALSFINQINVSCFGGSNASIGTSPSGGTPNYTYSWSPTTSTNGSLFNIAAGIYTVTLHDNNNCILQSTVSILQPTLALSVTPTSSSVTCNNGANGSVNSVANGGTSGYTYIWMPGSINTQNVTNLSSGTYTVNTTDSKGCIASNTVFVSQPAPIVAIITSTSAVCSGSNGAASVSVTGGLTPYTYQWLPSGGTNTVVSNIASGSYSVKVTDANNCNTIKQFNINNIGGPIINIYSITNVSCHGGSDGVATASVTGGSGVFTYSWTPYGGTGLTATGLSAGSYNLTVYDSNGCIALATTNPSVAEPPAIIQNIVSNNVTCFGGANGSATISVSGGTPSYTTTWLPSGTTGNTITNLSAGAYSVQVADSKNCLQTFTYTINQPTAALVATTTATDVTCFGGTNGNAFLTATGGTSPYNYNWMPGNISGQSLSNLTIGSYTATVTDIKNCVSTSVIAISQPLDLGLTPSSVNSNCGLANGQTSVSVSGGTGSYSYSWSPTGGNTNTANGLSAGSYSIQVLDGNNCVKTASISVTDNPIPTLSILLTSSVSCFGGNNGTATSTITGGTGPFTYTWLPTGGNTSIGTNLSTGIYTLQITSANNCLVSVVSPSITQATQQFANINTTAVSCFGGANGSATVTSGGGTAGYTYNWLSTSTTGTSVVGLSVGNQSVQVTDANNCVFTQTFAISQPTAPLMANTTTSAVSCFGGSNGTASVTATGGTAPYNFNWQPLNVNNTTISGLITGIYSVTATDAKNCITTATVLVSQPSQSLHATTNSVPTICYGGSDGTATVTPIGGTAGYTYSWSPVTATTSAIYNLSLGIYYVSITDANNCKFNTNVIISTPAPLYNTLTHIDAACGLSNGSIASQVYGGQGPYTYSWSPVALTTPTLNGLSPGGYTLYATDFYGCTKTSTTSLVNIPSPSVAIVSNTNITCFGQADGAAIISINQGTTPYTISWLPYGGNTTSASQLSANNYSATVIDGRGCIVTVTVAITEPSVLAISSTSITNVSCFGGTNGAISINVTGGSPTYTYTWLPVGVGTGTNISNLPLGTYTLLMEDSHQCKISGAITITQPTAPLTSTINNIVNLVCYSSLGAATANPIGGTTPYSYTWTSTPPQNGSSATNLLAGTYSVNIADANGCATSNTLILTRPTQVVGFSGLNDTICLGQTAMITCTANGGAGNYYYVWQPGATTNAGTLTPSPLGNTTYTVVAFDQNGCASAPNTIGVTVHVLGAANVQVLGTSPVCPGQPSFISANVMGNTGAVTYTWSNGLIGPGMFIVTPPQPMYYYVTVANNCGLTHKDSLFIDFYPLPTVVAVPNGSIACVPTQLQFFDNSTLISPNDYINGWLWDFGDGGTSNQQNPFYSYSTPGNYTITLTVTTDAGCSNNNASTPITLSAYQSPVAQFSVNSTVLNLPYDHLICNNQSTGATQYTWSFGDGHFSSEVHPHYLYNSVGAYQIQLIATSLQGCTDTAYANVVTDANVVFPNAFTPNPDGASGGYYTLGSLDNDIFFPYTSGVIDYKLQIFDRWGELIFETTDVKQGWDGYYRGQICQLGVYVWKAYVKLNVGKEYKLTGDVTLLR